MKRTAFSSVFALGLAAAASAHPHMLLEAKLTFEYGGRECLGVWAEWGFDPYFSASIIQDFDKNKDGRFDSREVRAVHDNAFTNLRNYGYFVFLRNGDRRRNPEKVEGFAVWQEKNQLFYKFYIPLAGQGYGEDFSLSIFDSTYFCAVRYAKNPVAIVQKGTGDPPACELVTNKKYPVYYNPSGAASDLRTYEKWQPGLQKAYPEEIHVYFGG